ncbi:GntR family transcriptional regulator [Anaerocolumna jejuensis]|uniref:GntR family transcriptional regulator n=1 Tax=Anaerocolumna jejuensis TaxID=259063 RepID=UPI003F7C3B5C
MALEKTSHQPLYQQLMEELKMLIHTGVYKYGERIPTEPELAQQYEVSRITVRRTIEELCSQGYLVKQQGKGTFVETPKIYRKVEQHSNMSFTEACKMNDRRPSSHVLSCDMIEPDERHENFLNLSKGEKIIFIQRVLAADEIPVIYENIYLPYMKFKGFDAWSLENGSLFQILKEQYNVISSEKSRSTIEIGTANQKMSAVLNIVTGEPIMILSSYMEDDKNNPLYMSKEFIVGSRYMISI